MEGRYALNLLESGEYSCLSGMRGALLQSRSALSLEYRLGHPLALERRLVHRRLLGWVHAVLALIAAIIYLSRINFTGFVYWRSGCGRWAVAIAALPMLSYAMSAILSRRLLTEDGKRVALFIVVLVLGLVLMGWLWGGAFAPVSPGRVLLLLGVPPHLHISRGRASPFAPPVSCVGASAMLAMPSTPTASPPATARCGT
jgi:hypothetical protein